MNRIALAFGLFTGIAATVFAADAPNATIGSNLCTLIVRLDDYTPFPLPGHSAAKFEQAQRLFELFEKHNVVLVVGVVPFTESDAAPRKPESATAEESWLSNPENPWVMLLKQYVDRGIVEPSLHGFTHRRSSEARRPGEFENKPQEWQLRALRVGRSALENALHRPIQGFIPPWNAWDQSTARAMDDLGFEWLSPDLHHADAGPTKLRIIPQCSSQPKEVLQWIRENRIPVGATVVLVTHPFDFDDSQAGDAYYQGLDELLSTMGASSQWRCSSFSDAISRNPMLGSPRGLADAVNVEQLGTLELDSLGGRLCTKAPTYLLAGKNAESARTLMFEVLLLAILTFAAACASAYFVGAFVQIPRGWRSIGILAAFGAIVVLLFGAWTIQQRGYHVRGIRWQFVIACTGGLAGLAYSRRRVNSRKRQRMLPPEDHAERSRHEASAR